MINRVIILVMDSVGIGALPDSEKFGDIGVNTLGNIAKKTGGIDLPNLVSLGLGNIDGIEGIKGISNPIGCYGKSMEISNGKDTTTGHWEIAGLYIKEPFKTYPNGFPKEVIEKFEKLTGRKVLGNKPASGTVIIEELGREHIKTGNPIVYTSADSVFQIAAHEEVIPLNELYKMCEIAREILRGEHQVARVIARPFVGKPGSFERTSNRKDYSLDPFGKTILDIVSENGYDVMAVGKIEDIFNGRGITKSIHTKDNMDGVDKTIEFLKTDNKGIIFTNLVDFDSKYGHRRNVEGYKKALEELDARIPELLESLKEDDMLIITADHGNDPTYKGTDHTREYIPILVYGDKIKSGVNIGTRKTFADIAATIADIFDVQKTQVGTSFKELILK
ncbi:phosphopentomutase [Caminicella sporogenes DSM 14501]|uniref:Phosphopentomutase n=1 Tax=Caminicella sporogenes DSM 14501 TaxID=1121266 RepID=A0A1M6LK99_9FIRM|nr:phosphopentomutase [Caminicella sporogenes]RKD27859.1 phosphopentomutase [Caminicella sporogenes]WIF94559.1 phosphopentomutase [Caminicella sporogenes]SHJ71575.1 phosphopentomutase [Caminicella sporogenes DSM 14501]